MLNNSTANAKCWRNTFLLIQNIMKLRKATSGAIGNWVVFLLFFTKTPDRFKIEAQSRCALRRQPPPRCALRRQMLKIQFTEHNISLCSTKLSNTFRVDASTTSINSSMVRELYLMRLVQNASHSNANTKLHGQIVWHVDG